MTSPISNLLKELESARDQNRLQLPSLPDVVLAIRDAVQDERKGIAHIARMLQMEPVMAARILKVANSPLYHTGTTLNDIKLAVTRLGLATTRNLVTCLAMHNLFDVKSFVMRERVRNLWQHSCRVAAIAQVLGRSQRGMSSDKALLAGLVHDIGVLPILVFADGYPDLYDQPQQIDQTIQSLRVVLGVTILKNWGMDSDIVKIPEVIGDYRYDHSGSANYGDLVLVAQLHSLFGERRDERLPPLSQVPAFGKLSISKLGPDASVELIQQANHEIAMTIRLLSHE